jgi:hypothetical protein
MIAIKTASIRLSLAIVFGVGLVTSARATLVMRADQAIAIASKACDDNGTWKKVLSRYGGSTPVPDYWHATLAVDYWNVWYGPDMARTQMSISVRRDGQPSPNNVCVIVIPD